ncbi:MAG: B12-binding domain-containing radical SAM protein [Candidatus Helarchaeota archaeon]
MNYLQSEGYHELLFTDDCFNANPRRILRLVQLIKREKLDFDWHINGRINRTDVPLLRTMVQVGCKTIIYGIESANQRILDYYHKRTTPAMALTAVKNAKKSGIEYIGAGFIIGAPIETREEVLNTIKFGMKLQEQGLTAVQFQLLFLSPGTVLYNQYQSQGYIDPEKDWGNELVAVDVVPSSLSRQYLEVLAKEAYKQFITNQHYLIYEFLKSIRSSYRLQGIYRLLHSRKNF